jgi:hypothetical protein
MPGETTRSCTMMCIEKPRDAGNVRGGGRAVGLLRQIHSSIVCPGGQHVTAGAFSFHGEIMRAREFVWTWWGGLLADTFGPKSVFRCARVRHLRRLACASSDRRGRPKGATRRTAAGAAVVQSDHFLGIG